MAPLQAPGCHTDAEVDAARITDGLGESWELPKVSIKPFPACHFVHSDTWAAGELATEHELEPGDVEAVVVRVPREGEALVLDSLPAKLAPRTPYDAKFSLPYAVAHQLVHGRLDVASFTDEAIHDPEVLTLAARVSAEPLDAAPSRFSGGTRIITRAGEEHDRFLPYAPGSPRNPLSEDWIRDNAELALDAERAEELDERLLALDEERTLERVMGLATEPAAVRYWPRMKSPQWKFFTVGFTARGEMRSTSRATTASTPRS